MTEETTKRTIRNQDVVIYADFKSRSAFVLAEALGAFRWYAKLPRSFPARPNPRTLVVNFGTGWSPSWTDRLRDVRILNSYRAIEASVDKRSTLRELHEAGVPTLDYVVSSRGVQPDFATLHRWLTEDGRVIVRESVEGDNGRGIVVARRREELGSAALYTRYYPKTHEFRVHVWNGRVIDLKQKRLLNEAPDNRIEEIRSYNQGWIHSQRLDPFVVGAARQTIEEAAIAANRALGLHFGGIDVLARFTRGSFIDCKVCETNTAPDLTAHDSTLEAYANEVRREYREYKHADMAA